LGEHRHDIAASRGGQLHPAQRAELDHGRSRSRQPGSDMGQSCVKVPR
jgi:hypothetical protein